MYILLPECKLNMHLVYYRHAGEAFTNQTYQFELELEDLGG